MLFVLYYLSSEIKHYKILHSVRSCFIISFYQSSSCEALVSLFSWVSGFFCLNAATLLLLGISTLRHSVNEKDIYHDCT